MYFQQLKKYSILVILALMVVTVFDSSAFARAGGGRSFGSRGSRGFSVPSRSYNQPAPSRQVSPDQSPNPARRDSGGFLRSIGGGLLGGFLGSMLFRGFGPGGGGIPLFGIILICGIGYLVYRMVMKRRQESVAYQVPPPPPGQPREMASYTRTDVPPYATADTGLETGLSHIRQLDPSFDEQRFCDLAMDIFFKIQGAWMNRDLAPVTGLLDDEMRRILQEDVDRLRAEKRINRLENIAVRNTDLAEAWQESGLDFVTIRFYANLMDYTTDEAGVLVEGSRTEPVKFEEYWTFSRPAGTGSWQLSAIAQA